MTAIDTNILVYAFDRSETKKHPVCRRIFLDVMEGRREGVVTNQILAEFAAVMLRKVRRKVDPRDVRSIIGGIVASPNWKIYNYTPQTVINSIAEDEFWDNLIANTLQEHGVKKIVTENAKDFPQLKTDAPF